MKNNFLLDPDVIFLNHGSFGACPQPVFKAYQRWQHELERQPVAFLGRRVTGLLAEARASLAEFLGCSPDDVVYFPNPTTAINMVVRSLDLKPGDEVLTTNHEYGAMDRTWRYICRATGAKYVQQPVPLPLSYPAKFVDTFWAGVTPKTRVIFLSHITSPTALVFPVAAICGLAREAGILTIVDGAHAPGQIPVDLGTIGADLYTGACHKWMLSPKGASFLYARPEVQTWLDPLVVSWGYDSDPGFGSGSQFIDYHEWQGTRDLAAYLAVPAAIDYMIDNNWDQVQAECHAIALKARGRINQLTGLDSICGDDQFGQMFAARLPKSTSPDLQKRLYEKYKIEVPLTTWGDKAFIRVSIQAYNSECDVTRLVEALDELLRV